MFDLLWRVGFSFAAKSRRQPKPYKPKKMIKLETKTAVYTACNNGSSSIVTKDGELYMFGKDAIYSDSTCEWSKAKLLKIFVPLVKSDCVFIVYKFVYIFFNISPSNPQAKWQIWKVTL